MRPAVFTHAVSVAFWAGALVPLALMFARHLPQAVPSLRQFSSTIPYALTLLLAAGIVLAVVQVETPSALVNTAYGQVLVAKLGLVALLLLLAAINRWRLTHPAERGSSSAGRALARSIAVETALVVLIFATAALWRFTPPPRALAAAVSVPAQIHIHTAPAMADLVVTPGRAGPVSAAITVMTGDYGPLDAKQVTLILANPAAGIEPMRRPTARQPDGIWHTGVFTLPVSGRWTVRIDILISDFEIAKLDGTLDIRP